MYNKMRGRDLIKIILALYLTANMTLGEKVGKSKTEVQPIDESEDSGSGDQKVKGLINSLNLNEKVEIDSKNPTLKELKEKIEGMLKRKKEEMKEEEKKKSDDKVVNLEPKNNGADKKVDEDKKEPTEKEAKNDVKEII